MRRVGWRNILIVAAGLLVALYILGSGSGERTTPLPTLAVLSVPTEAPPTAQATATTTASATPTAAASATITDTPRPSATALPTQTPTDRATSTPDVIAVRADSYYAARDVNLRRCPETTCERVGTLAAGTALAVDGVTEGEEVTVGNGLWYRVQYGGMAAYVYSELVTREAPAQSAPVQSIPVQPVQPASQWSCGGDSYNCSDFSSRAELMSYFNACPGDPSRLDNNNDGVPCESLR